MKSCIIFDLDGTLVDSRADLCTGVNLMRGDFDLPPLPPEQIVTYVGNGTSLLCERALQGTAISVDDALPRLKKHYREHLLDQTRLYPGAEEGLRQLHHAGIPLAVISNKLETPSKLILEGLGVAGLFQYIIGGDSGFKLKPDPDSLLHVVNAVGAEATRSYMVGDNYTDLASARMAKMLSVYAAYGFGVLKDEKYDFRIDDFAGLVKLVMK